MNSSKEYPDREIIIAMDQAGWHKAKDLKHPDTITLMYLPSYSPELNPVEKLWQWLRKEVTHNAVFHKLEDMMDALEHEIRRLTSDRTGTTLSLFVFMTLQGGNDIRHGVGFSQVNHREARKLGLLRTQKFRSRTRVNVAAGAE